MDMGKEFSTFIASQSERDSILFEKFVYDENAQMYNNCEVNTINVVQVILGL